MTLIHRVPKISAIFYCSYLRHMLTIFKILSLMHSADNQQKAVNEYPTAT